MSISSKVLGDKDTSLHLDQIYFLKQTRVKGVIKKNTTHELNWKEEAMEWIQKKEFWYAGNSWFYALEKVAGTVPKIFLLF